MNLYIEKNNSVVKALQFHSEITSDLKELGLQEPPDSIKELVCKTCGAPLSCHALLLQNTTSTLVCPEDYVIVRPNNYIQVMSKTNFELFYKKIYED